MAENILVVGNEQYYGATTRTDRSNVRFFDIGNEGSITELSHLLIERRGSGKIASAVALTKNGNQWILAVRAENSIDFYTLEGNILDRNSQFVSIGSLDNASNGLKGFQAIQMFPGTGSSGKSCFLPFWDA